MQAALRGGRPYTSPCIEVFSLGHQILAASLPIQGDHELTDMTDIGNSEFGNGGGHMDAGLESFREGDSGFSPVTSSAVPYATSADPLATSPSGKSYFPLATYFLRSLSTSIVGHVESENIISGHTYKAERNIYSTFPTDTIADDDVDLLIP